MLKCPVCNADAQIEPVCAECLGHAEERGCGDEGWTVCNDCRAVEQGYLDAIVCDNHHVTVMENKNA